MKYKIQISILVLMLLFLTGCDKKTTDITEEITSTVTSLVTSDNTNQTTAETTETTTEIQTTILPTINMVGESIIVVEKDSVFTDPGAVLLGGLDLQITTNSNVDTSVVGEYLITYSVEYGGITYSVTRTVHVVVYEVPDIFNFSMVTTETTYNSISITISYTDTDGLLLNTKASLYKDDVLVLSYDIFSGTNYLNFTGLDDDTEYTVVLEGSFDVYGTAVDISGEVLTITTSILSVIDFTISNEEITYDSYDTDIEVVDTTGAITEMTVGLYEGETLIEDLTPIIGTSSFSVADLSDETEYVLKVTYTYTPQAGGANITETEVLSTFTTSAIPVPTILDFVCVPDINDIECTFTVDETGVSNVAIRVEVWVDGSYNSLFHATNNNTLIEIDSLSSGTEYTIKLYTDYTVADTLDDISYVLLDEITVNTLGLVTYTAPSISNLVITKVVGETESVTFEFDLNDPDATIEGHLFLRMYNSTGSQTVKVITVGHNIITIDDYLVKSNSAYTLKITADYQVDETTTVYDEVIYEEDYFMPPVVDAISLSFEKSMYFFGERIILVLELDNVDEVEIEYVTINGTKIYKEDFLFPSNLETVFLNMGIETSYTDYTYHMTDFAVTVSDDSSFVIDYDETITFRLQQPGDIDPEDALVSVLEITSDDLTELVTSSGTDYGQITVHLDNPYNLEVYSITISGTTYLASQFEAESTAKQIVLNVEVSQGSNSFLVTDFVFIRNDVNVNGTISYLNSLIIYGHLLEDSVTISTAAELNSINPDDNKYYILANDIDLTGFPFTPIGTSSSPFQGVFDGNGYTISNLTLVSNEASQLSTVYLGLFGNSNGFIYNVNLENVTITVNTDDTHNLYVGSLVGKTTGSVINAHVMGTNTITINGNNKGYIGGLIGVGEGFIRDTSANVDIVVDGLNSASESQEAFVGGLIGLGGIGNIETSSSTGSITITNTNNVTYHVGGLIGLYGNLSSASATRNNIWYSYSTVDITTTNYGQGTAGGLVGKFSNQYATSGIVNSYATGDIYSVRGYVGGLVGYGYIYIENSFATGNVSSESAFMGRLTAYGNDIFISNCYTYDLQTLNFDGSPNSPTLDKPGIIVAASISEYNDSEFYTRVLGWSTYFYDFSVLDFANGDLPVHN